MKKHITPLFFIIFPNIFWLVLAFCLDLDRSIINIDYFFIFLFLRYRFFAISIFLIINFFDFLNLFSQVFAFIRITDLFYLVKFSLISSFSNLYYLLVFFIYFIFSLVLIFKNKINNLMSILVFFNILIFFMLIEKNLKDNENLYVKSEIYSIYEKRSRGFFENFKENGSAIDFNSNITASSTDLINNSKDFNKIILILNESWGVIDQKIQEDIISPLKDNKFEYRLSELSSSGFTLDAELRELCHKRIIHFNMKNQIVGFDNCLPNKFKEIDYKTVAIHASTGFMYDRKYWYPRAGFQEIYFKENMLNIKSKCYSFPGMCDRDLVSIVKKQLVSSDKVFLYWLTLNTHFKYDLRDLKYDIFNCSNFNIVENSLECNNLKLQKQFFYTLSGLLNTIELQDAYVIVVGDHPPAMYGQGREIFNKDKVPILKIQFRR